MKSYSFPPNFPWYFFNIWIGFYNFFRRPMILFLTTKIFDFIKHRTVLHKGCHTQLDVWLSMEKVNALKWNNTRLKYFLNFPWFFKNLTFLWFSLTEHKIPWFSQNSSISLEPLDFPGLDRLATLNQGLRRCKYRRQIDLQCAFTYFQIWIVTRSNLYVLRYVQHQSW